MTRHLLSCFLILQILLSVSCMEQYNIWPFWDKLKKERKIAHAPTPKLTKDGKIPEKEDSSTRVAVSGIDQKYNSFCSTCHGMDGQGHTPMAKGLNPPPRNLTDLSWQKKTTDQRIYKVLKEGGTSVGLSATMAAWGGVLSEDEIWQMVKKVRSFAKKK